MKIVLCTTPIRPVPTDYPPFGSLALVQALRASGYDPYFYDIDGLRPSFEEVLRFFQEQKPDLIGISAVVSTAYAYTKKLSLALKELLPNTPIVVGGNLAASAELLHRFCKVDVCVAGEGERPIVNLAHYFEKSGGKWDPKTLRQVKGLTFLDQNKTLVFTDYEVPLTIDEFQDPDFSILEKYSRIENFIREPQDRPEFARDPRTYEPHRRGQKMATLISAKGCVARCTFCHRWDKGYRHLSPQVVVGRMKYLRDRYHVGFFCFGDENFGSDRKKLEELIDLIKPLDILYQVAGVRVRSVEPDLLHKMKESGCAGLYYGMETGSPRILKVMEKNATLEDNTRTALWTEEQGLYTIYQLVLAMPGENNETVAETIEFLKKITEKRQEPPHKLLSINYIQALPGTAVYEYAREKGFIRKTLEAEEQYLTRISDLDANDDNKFLNFTEEDYFTVQSWRHKILFEVDAHWYRSRHWKVDEKLSPDGKQIEDRDYYTQGGYFNLKSVLHSPFFFRYFYFLRYPYYMAMVIVKELFKQPFRLLCQHTAEYLAVRWRKHKALADYRSLRTIAKETFAKPLTENERNMAPLRQGR